MKNKSALIVTRLTLGFYAGVRYQSPKLDDYKTSEAKFRISFSQRIHFFIYLTKILLVIEKINDRMKNPKKIKNPIKRGKI